MSAKEFRKNVTIRDHVFHFEEAGEDAYLRAFKDGNVYALILFVTAKKDGEEYERRLADLQAQLDRELEWKPSEGTGTNMSQSDYEALAALCDGTHGDPHEMTDDEARALIASEFGFAVEKVVIIHAYEVNKHCQLRKSAEYIRRPMYDVSDYNYVRFDVDCGHMTWMYEMVNGELKTYDC